MVGVRVYMGISRDEHGLRARPLMSKLYFVINGVQNQRSVLGHLQKKLDNWKKVDHLTEKRYFIGMLKSALQGIANSSENKHYNHLNNLLMNKAVWLFPMK